MILDISACDPNAMVSCTQQYLTDVQEKPTLVCQLVKCFLQSHVELTIFKSHSTHSPTGEFFTQITDRSFDIQGGGLIFFSNKNSLFPYWREKNKKSSTKLKIKSLFFIQ